VAESPPVGVGGSRVLQLQSLGSDQRSSGVTRPDFNPAVRDTRHDQRLGDNLDAAGPSCTPRALPILIQLLT
jgi:hypothetical protein